MIHGPAASVHRADVLWNANPGFEDLYAFEHREPPPPERAVLARPRAIFAQRPWPSTSSIVQFVRSARQRVAVALHAPRADPAATVATVSTLRIPCGVTFEPCGWTCSRENRTNGAMQDPKEVAGRRAAEFVEDGMTLGLGTGSTVHFTLLAIAERIRDRGLRVRGVPTSLDTERKARELGIPLATLDDVEAIDLTIDGADEIDAAFDMIKGGGGALLREKVVASITRTEVIVVGANKVVSKLGTTFALPVEVVPFARATVERALRRLGCEPKLRANAAGVYMTDNSNHVLDCRFPAGIADARALETKLAHVPGIVESGLFVGLAHVVVVGNADGSCEVRRKRV